MPVRSSNDLTGIPNAYSQPFLECRGPNIFAKIPENPLRLFVGSESFSGMASSRLLFGLFSVC